MTFEQPSKPLSILVVEDETLIVMLLESMLLSLGCRVVGPSATVAPAIAFIEANAQDLDGAFLDVNLRGEFVYPVADLLQARKVPFMFLTGYALQGIDPRYSSVPALKKPFLTRTVSDAVRTFDTLRLDRIGSAA